MKKTIPVCILSITFLMAGIAFADDDITQATTLGGGISASKSTSTTGGNTTGVGGHADFSLPYVDSGSGYGNLDLSLDVKRDSATGKAITTGSGVFNWSEDGFGGGEHIGFHHELTATEGSFLVNPVSAGYTNQGPRGRIGIYADPWAYYQDIPNGLQGNFAGLHINSVLALGKDVMVIANVTAGGTYGMNRGISTNSVTQDKGCDNGVVQNPSDQSTTTTTCSGTRVTTTFETQPGISSGAGAMASGNLGMVVKLGESGWRLKAQAACDTESTKGTLTHYVTGNAGTTTLSAHDCSGYLGVQTAL